MPETAKVRFTLFGGLRGFQNGAEFKLPEKTAGAYLRLLLLSGALFLDNDKEERRYLGSADSIRTILVKANKPPILGQWSRFDFFAQSGLELKYRDRAGICLAGGAWTSDVREFEEIWGRRGTAALSELDVALELSKPGINLEEWPPERVLADCWMWAEKRVKNLRECREQIYEEILARSRNAKAAEQRGFSSEGADAGVKQERPFSAETSGSQETTSEPTYLPESSTSLDDPLRAPQSATLGAQSTLEHDPYSELHVGDGQEPWLLEWIKANPLAAVDMDRAKTLRKKYPTTPGDIEIFLSMAGPYALDMLRADDSRANGLFPKRLRSKPRTSTDRLPKSSKMEMQLYTDVAKEANWNALLKLEQLRRETAKPDARGLSESEKRLYRAGLLWTCNRVATRYKELERLRIRDAKKVTGRSDDVEAFIQKECDALFTFLLGIIHLQNFRIVEAHVQEHRTGGLDPRSLPLLPGESSAARRARADKKVWSIEVLSDLIVVPDWSQPIAADLSAQHQAWIDDIRAAQERDKAERQARNAAKRADFKPIPDRASKMALLIIPASIVSGWVTFVGLGSLGTYIWVKLEWARLPPGLPTESLWGFVMPSMMISAILGLPVWAALSYGFFNRYDEAYRDRDIRSSFGCLTSLLLLGLFGLAFVAIMVR